MKLRPFALYLITDRKLTPDLVLTCEAAISAARPGEIALQLREKDLPARELLELARRLRGVCDRHGALLLVNDRVDVALAAGADGVHLAANSMSVGDARALLGERSAIGVSTHTEDEVAAVATAGADFVVFGPVFDPISKGVYGAAVGAEGLERACRAAAIAVYALGGITAERAMTLSGCGAAGIAAIGAVMGAIDPRAATRAILDAVACWPGRAQ